MIRNYLELTRTSNINVYKFLNFEKIILTMSSKRIRELLDVKKEDEGISIMKKKRNFCTFLSESVDLTKKSEEKDQTKSDRFYIETWLTKNVW